MSYPFPGALWRLSVPEASPSLNAFANKRSPFVYPRLRGRWERLIRDAWYVARAEALVLSGFVPPPRARLTVYRYSAADLDRDNLTGGLKPVLDALRRCGLIADDAPDVLALDVHQERAPAAGTVLVLTVWREHGEA